MSDEHRLKRRATIAQLLAMAEALQQIAECDSGALSRGERDRLAGALDGVCYALGATELFDHMADEHIKRIAKQHKRERCECLCWVCRTPTKATRYHRAIASYGRGVG